jgi:NAD(P)-dependent dehydrogenase (short-subunit alcohol dehydrogenase family)
MAELTGRRGLVTGASGLLGRAIARRLAEEGASLVIAGRDERRLAETLAEIAPFGGRHVAHTADLARRDEVTRLADATLDAFGGTIDLLVNNAGMSIVGPFLETTESAMTEQLEVDFVAPFVLAQHAARAMPAGGSIIFISSTGATTAHGDRATYDAMKGALESLTRALAFELGRSGIRVNAIEPGFVVGGSVADDGSGYLERQRRAIPLGRPGAPEDVAEAVVYLATERSGYVNGTVLRVDGGRTARWAVDWP